MLHLTKLLGYFHRIPNSGWGLAALVAGSIVALDEIQDKQEVEDLYLILFF